jgi:superfamily II DNA or RNA helicase
MTLTTPGSLVRYREREWVVLPSDDPNLILLRPIGGSGREVCGVVKPLADLMAYEAPHERIEPAQFPLPSPEDVQDHAAVRLLLESARLLLRDGAAPFRALGHLSVRPRPYQFVPLVMALRQPTVRLLIADDVGVGKTIEAALIARELLDRGTAHRVAVLCPPYLCEQWQRELAEKFHIEAVVIRAGTVARLERQTPQDRSIFQHFRHFVASIDTVKGDHYRAAFLQHCPDLVLVDEAHGAAQPPAGRASAQQQRHALLLDLAKKPERSLILLSATPHSGVESSFQSLLGLLRPDFRFLSLAALSEAQMGLLAKHFVQRRRADVHHWMGEDTPFPVRDPEGAEQPYRFSPAYRKFYEQVYEFAGEMVRSAETLSGWKQRMRFYSVLALLRCVSSSPAAAQVALLKRAGTDGGAAGADESGLDDWEAAGVEAEFTPLVYDPTEAEAANDAPPSAVFDAQERDPAWGQSDQGRLRRFAGLAAALRGKEDTKLQKLIEVTSGLLTAGYQPIVWCRYIATADYVAEELGKALASRFPSVRIVAVTGALAEDERRLKIDSLAAAPVRVLVATDCLSEGINLQESFSAVVHYDLPWNPNRLEQREGRVDRFGQKALVVKAIMIFGQDNPVDGAVLDVLLRKARDIYRELGVHVPVPMDSETVMEAVLHSLFERSTRYDGQMALFDQTDDAGRLVRRVHDEWTSAADRERESRTRFAQRAISPAEVQRALGETDAVLGSPEDVRRFLVQASQRLPFGLIERGNGRYDLLPGDLPEAVRMRLGDAPAPWPVTFRSPTPAGLTYVGRNHPLIEGLSEHLMDTAFHPAGGDQPVARCGAVRTPLVTRRTALFLLRLRYLHLDSMPRSSGHGDGGAASLAEETFTWGLRGVHPDVSELDPAEAQRLMDGQLDAVSVPSAERQEVLRETLGWWSTLQARLAAMLSARAARLAEEHGRLADLVGSTAKLMQIEPQAPPDLLGLVVLLPTVPVS